MFELLKTDAQTSARCGRLTTAHGTVDTPAFLPVGTQATVKAISPRELGELRARVILANTYHLYVRPGLDVIRHFGGLHQFMNWDGPILTDSGGYQIFSLTRLRKLTPDGVHFQNHVDGTPTFLSPEIAMEIQAALGSDIAMVLDECAPYPCDYDYAAKSLEMTLRWARRCKDAANKESVELRHSLPAEFRAPNMVERSETGAAAALLSGSFKDPAAATATAATRQLVFGIVQGATYPELRRQSAEAIAALEFDGYAIGGVSVGEPESEMISAVESSVPYLPANKPHYAMGLGTPPQMLEMIARGIDMFDCVLPTRLARNGTAFTKAGTINLKNAEFTFDTDPIEEDCVCAGCREFTRGYIRHLIKAEEILGLRLIAVHNLHFYLELMRRARVAIEEARFQEFRRAFVAGYKSRSTGELPAEH